MKNFLSFETNPGVLAQFLWHLYMDKDKSSQIKQEKKIKPWKFGLFRLFYWPQTIQNENLGFCMIKWSLVTNIHWKFEGLWASSFGATKVYYLPFRFKYGVSRKNKSKIMLLQRCKKNLRSNMMNYMKYLSFENLALSAQFLMFMLFVWLSYIGLMCYFLWRHHLQNKYSGEKIQYLKHY